MRRSIIDGVLYLFGGIFNSRNGPGEVDVYDPVTDEWSERSAMPEVRNHFTVGHAVYDDEIWIAGGKLDGPGHRGSARVDIYDPIANTWREGPALPETHWAGPSVVIGDHLHVLTGAIDNNNSTDHHFALDLRDNDAGWEARAPVPEPRVHVAGVPFDGEIWLLGGEYHHRHDGDTTTVQVYDPSTDRWRDDAPALPEARSHHEWATFVYADSLWSVSGVDSGNNPRGQDTIYRLESGANQWKTLPLPALQVSPRAKFIGGALHVFGGGVNTWFDGDLIAHHVRCLAGDRSG